MRLENRGPSELQSRLAQHPRPPVVCTGEFDTGRRFGEFIEAIFARKAQSIDLGWYLNLYVSIMAGNVRSLVRGGSCTSDLIEGRYRSVVVAVEGGFLIDLCLVVEDIGVREGFGWKFYSWWFRGDRHYDAIKNFTRNYYRTLEQVMISRFEGSGGIPRDYPKIVFISNN